MTPESKQRGFAEPEREPPEATVSVRGHHNIYGEITLVIDVGPGRVRSRAGYLAAVNRRALELLDSVHYLRSINDG